MDAALSGFGAEDTAFPLGRALSAEPQLGQKAACGTVAPQREQVIVADCGDDGDGDVCGDGV